MNDRNSSAGWRSDTVCGEVREPRRSRSASKRPRLIRKHDFVNTNCNTTLEHLLTSAFSPATDKPVCSFATLPVYSRHKSYLASVPAFTQRFFADNPFWKLMHAQVSLLC